MTTRAQARLLDLIERHEDVVLAALGSYHAEIEESRAECAGAAAECQAGYDTIKDDPAARAAQDHPVTTPGTISLAPTTMGLYHMAQMFTEAAAKHAGTLAALDEISQALCPDDEQET